MARIFHALLIVFFFTSCKTTTYFISRHAERAGTMSNDPQLTPEGEKQALDLRDYLKDKNIRGVYSTNFNRTRATARPTSEHFNLPVNIYNPQQANTMLDSLKANNKNNILIVGHSNTVDDIVNRLTETAAFQDLPETTYGKLYIVRKKGKKTVDVTVIDVPKTTPR